LSGTRGDAPGSAIRAIAECEKALRFNPDHAQAQHELAEVLEKKGDARQPLEHSRIALELEPKNSDFRANYRKLTKSARPEIQALSQQNAKFSIDSLGKLQNHAHFVQWFPVPDAMGQLITGFCETPLYFGGWL